MPIEGSIHTMRKSPRSKFNIYIVGTRQACDAHLRAISTYLFLPLPFESANYSWSICRKYLIREIAYPCIPGSGV